MLTVLDLAQEDTQLKKASINEQAGPCPNAFSGKCSKRTDGFRVRWKNGKWAFMCRGCWDSQEIVKEGKRAGKKRGWGDEIDYLRHFRGMPFQQAKATCEGQETPVSVPVQEMHPYLTDDWQTSAARAMKDYTARLWDETDTTALDYARSRGLSDDIIRQFQFGYSLKGGIPRLMIPSMNEGRYVAIYRRDLRPDIPKDERWKDAPGGTKSELYLADILTRRQEYPVVLCEDAFSALSIWQKCSDLVNVVATGSANCGQNVKSLARLALAPLVLVAFDADASGDKESKWWLARLKNARRMRPLLKDPNDMHCAGYDLREWITGVLANVTQPIAGTAPDTLLVCSDCKRNDTNPDETFFYDDDGVCLCPECWQRRQMPAVTYAPDPEQESPPPMEQVLLHIEHVDAIKALMRGEIDGPIFLCETPPSWSQDEWMKDVAKEYEAMYRRGEQAKARMFLERISQYTRVKAS